MANLALVTTLPCWVKTAKKFRTHKVGVIIVNCSVMEPIVTVSVALLWRCQLCCCVVNCVAQVLSLF